MRETPKEAQEQKVLFEWLAINSRKWPELRLCFAIPNGGRRDTIEAKHLKDQGVKPGVPDVCLPAARGPWHGLYIELKRRKGGRLSDAQRRWLEALRKQGYAAYVAYGWKDAAALIEDYLNERGV